jgi:hypothetical protein
MSDILIQYELVTQAVSLKYGYALLHRCRFRARARHRRQGNRDAYINVWHGRRQTRVQVFNRMEIESLARFQ